MTKSDDFNISNGVLVAYNGSECVIEIPNGVTSIADNAFNDSNIEAVKISDGVVGIGESAFEDCILLEKVTLPQSLNQIGWGAFYGCSELTSVTIPENVTELPAAIFSGCEKLCEVMLPQALISIGGGAFQHCGALKEMRLPDSLKNIGDSAFAFCDNLLSIKVPSEVCTIGASAFEGCSNLQTLYIPHNIEYLNDYCFKDCVSLKTIEFDGTLAQWEQVKKGKNWNEETSFTVVCTDGRTSVKNKDKQVTLKDYKDLGIKVKVTTIEDWDMLNDLNSSSIQLIYTANHILARRRIAYILSALLLLTATILISYKYTLNGFDLVSAVVIDVISALIIIFAISRWRRQLKSYKFFCELYKLQPFNGFGSFMFAFTRFIGFTVSLVWLAISMIFGLIIAFIASGKGVDGSTIIGFGAFNDRLGIPENIGYDTVIERGNLRDETDAAIIQSDIKSTLAYIDNAIETAAVDSDYAVKKDKLEKIQTEIKKLEKRKDELSEEEKYKLGKLKQKADETQNSLENSYRDAKAALQDNLDTTLQEIKDDYDTNIQPLIDRSNTLHDD